MMTVLLGAVSNIILDPIFIFVLDMGVGEPPSPRSYPSFYRRSGLSGS